MDIFIYIDLSTLWSKTKEARFGVGWKLHQAEHGVHCSARSSRAVSETWQPETRRRRAQVCLLALGFCETQGFPTQSKLGGHDLVGRSPYPTSAALRCLLVLKHTLPARHLVFSRWYSSLQSWVVNALVLCPCP